jgi:hypothetical protein
MAICKILDREDTDPREHICPGKFHLLKFASMTLCNVERSFSAYKRNLSDRCVSMTAENMKYLVVHCV